MDVRRWPGSGISGHWHKALQVKGLSPTCEFEVFAASARSSRIAAIAWFVLLHGSGKPVIAKQRSDVRE